MNRRFIDFLKQNSLLDVICFTKLGLRFFYKREILKIKRGLKDIENGKDIRVRIESFQKKKLINLCRFAYKNNEYYKRIFQKVNLDLNNLSNFDSIPILDKTIIRKHEDELITKSLRPWEYYEGYTGGSTGEPLRLFLSPKVGIIDDIHQEYYAKYIGYRKGDSFISFSGSSVPSKLRNRNIFWISNKHNLPFGKKTYSSLYFKNKNKSQYLADFLKVCPSLIRGYPSTIYDFVRYVDSMKAKISFKIKGVILTSEQAFDWQIKKIARVLDTNIFFQYGHTEACVFAYTLKNSTKYLCSPFYGFTEILDEKGKHVKKGSAGEIVVTGFYNYAMPFIRYRTGDIAVYGGLKNGVVCLRELQGRTQDYIYGSSGDKTPLTALVFGQHYKAFRNIKKWQIIQSEKGIVIIKIIPDRLFGLKDKLEINEKFLKLADTKVKFKYVRSIPLSKRGKFLFLIQKIKK